MSYTVGNREMSDNRERKCQELCFSAGDVVEIVTPGGKSVVGWVIYVSAYFKDLLGVLVYQARGFQIGSLPNLQPLTKAIYTSGKAAKHYGWKLIGHLKPDTSAIDATKRIVGGELFCGDECVGVASEQDREAFPKMLVKGMPVVFGEIEAL